MGKKRRQDEQNVSGEKPNKKTNNTQSMDKNVNKPKPKGKQDNKQKNSDESLSQVVNNNMSDNMNNIPNCGSQNQGPAPTFHQYPVSQQAFNPNIVQPSPTSPAQFGWYPGTPQQFQPIMQSSMNENDSKLDSLTRKVDMIFQRLSVIDKLSDKLNKFDNTVQKMIESVDAVTKRVDEVEKSMDFINKQFEKNKTDVDTVKTKITDIRHENEGQNDAIARLQADLDDLYEKHIDLQTRSMRENLIFTGIPLEQKDEESDLTEKVLETFMKKELKLDTIPKYHRAHRFGREFSETNRDGSVKFSTRPIVCRFENFKQREIVRKAAINLKGTPFGVSEQFPKEINDRRKALWPFFQEARRQKKKAHFKKDKLFIDGNEFTPPLRGPENMETNAGNEHPRANYEHQGARPKQQQNAQQPRGGPRKRRS